MKHNVWNVLVGLVLFGFGFQAQAQLEKNEVYLFTCPIADDPIYQQIAVKYVTVEETDGRFEYFVMDVEAGNDSTGVHGEGHHLKFVKTLLTSQNAYGDELVQNSRTNYTLTVDFQGSASNSVVRVDFDLLRDGGLEMDLNGSGPIFNLLRSEFSEVMLDSNLYNRFDMPVCYSHPNLRNFLD